MSVAEPLEIQTPDARTADCRAVWWRCLFEGSEDPQFVCDSSGAVHDLNRKAAQLVGHKPGGEVLRLSVCDLFTPMTGKRLRQALARRAGSSSETLAAVTVLVEDKVSWIADVPVTPLSEGFSLVTIKDASQRWRMESHLQRLVAAIDATTDVFFLTNAEFKLIYVNCAFQSATGVTIEEALGRTADFLRAPSEAARIREYMARVQQGADWAGELINVRNDGTSYPVESIISPIHDKHGVLMGYVACERDITTKRKLQDEVLIERDFARSIVNSLDSAIYTIDRRLRLTHINDGWKKLPPHHGWLTMDKPPETGAPLLDYVTDPEKRAELQSVLESILVTRQPQELQATQNGLQWSIEISPWLHAGEVIGLIYHVADQSKYHELQKQLYQAQKMETIGALAAGVAHDFNNLLQAIRGNASLMLVDEKLPELVRSRLLQMDQAASRAADITQQLLSFSRASDEKVLVFDFNLAIEEVSHLARRSMKGNVELCLKPAPMPAHVKMDPTRAQQLLLNLCVNAQDAMPQGGTLTITNRILKLTPDQAAKANRLTDSMFLCCSVADTGTGIPSEVLPRILDPFFTTKAPGKGTGLGLSIVHSATRQAGGFLEIDSEEGRGTEFHIYLPLVDGAQMVKPAKCQPELIRGSGRILVVEDLDLVREFTRSFLSSAGFEVEVVVDGQEAMTLLTNSSEPFDLVLTDFNMPGMNGMELIQRSRAQWPHMKFILVSGYLEDEEREFVEGLPDTSVLNKPYNMVEAIDLILAMLGPTAIAKE